MAEYTGKKAQEKHAEAVNEAVSSISSELFWFTDRISKAEQYIKTGKKKFLPISY